MSVLVIHHIIPGMGIVRPRGRGGGVCVLRGHGDGVVVCLWRVVCFVSLFCFLLFVET